MQLSSALQEALLALLCYSPEFARQVAALVSYKFYDPYFSELAEEAEKYLTRYGQPPKAHTLDIVNLLSERSPEKAEPLKQIFRSLQKTRRSINHEYVLEQAGAFIRYQNLTRALTSAVRTLQKDDVPSLIEAENQLLKVLKTSHEVQHVGIRMDDPAQVLGFLRPQELSVFSTGIPALDAHDLGPGRKRLHVFVALPGVGKSWWLLHLAKQAMLQRLKVCYVSLELDEDEICQRTMQAFFAVPKHKGPLKSYRFEQDEEGKFIAMLPEEMEELRSLEDPDIERFLREQLEMFEGRLPIIARQFPTGALTIRELEAYLDVLESKCSFIPDLLIVDYADCMSIDSNNYRLEVGQIYKDLRGLAIKRNLAVATASQANRGSMKTTWLDKDSIAEDFSKIATADNVITYNQTKVEHEFGLARLFVAKARSDRDKFAVLISQSYAMGQFVLDSVGLSNRYWDEIKASVVPEGDVPE